LQRLGVVSLQFEDDRTEWQNNKKQPLEIGEWADRLIPEQKRVPAKKTQPMREPKRRNHEDTVGDLEKLEVEFLFATEHRFFCVGESLTID